MSKTEKCKRCEGLGDAVIGFNVLCEDLAQRLGVTDQPKEPDVIVDAVDALQQRVAELEALLEGKFEIHDCSKMKDEDYVCLDCGGPAEEFYVHDELWNGAVPENGQRMSEGKFTLSCIACFEKRIGRPLVASDFPKCPANTMTLLAFERGAR